MSSPQASLNNAVRPGIGLKEPAAEGDAVGDVDDAVRVTGVELAEHGLADQRGVHRRDAVDAAAAEESEVSHLDVAPLALVDQRDRRQPLGVNRLFFGRGFKMASIDQVDDLQMARQHPLEQRHRPAFERLGQQRVVGVPAGIDGDLPRLVPRHIVEIDEDAHQLGDGDARMGVVELDRRAVGQGMERAVMAAVALHEILKRGGDEEILLAQAQLTSGLRSHRLDRGFSTAPRRAPARSTRRHGRRG
jgi:hypothetical protein